MTSRKRLISVAVLIVCAILAAAAYALKGHSGSAANRAKSPVGSTAAAAPKPSAPAGKPSATWIPSNSAYQNVCRTKLPSQAQDTLGLIAKGGPFPYRSDGIVFENRENRLPRESAADYYHEYTVVTPGSDDRGTRRIVTGSAGEQYWTADHYSTFQGIDSRC